MSGDMGPGTWTGTSLADTHHACAFFDTDDEEYRALLPFVHDGLASGERAVHIVHREQHADHVHRLERSGIDADAVVTSGQLELHHATETYLRDGRFDADLLLDTFTRLAARAPDAPFPRTRTICRMHWMAGSRIPVEEVIEFEARVNEVWLRHPDVVICSYPLATLEASALLDILRTHPMVVVDGALHRNPYFVPPDQFLPEFRERRLTRDSSRRTGS